MTPPKLALTRIPVLPKDVERTVQKAYEMGIKEAGKERDELLQAIEAHRALWMDTRPVRDPALERAYDEDQALYKLADRIQSCDQGPAGEGRDA